MELREIILWALAEVKEHRDALEIIGKFIALIVGMIALLYLRKRSIASFNQSEAAMKQAHDGRRSFELSVFIKSVEQLGADSLAIRVGGIQALRSAYHMRNPFFGEQITAALNAFIKEHATDRESKASSIRLDIQAAITVLGKRPENTMEPLIDLRSVNLAGYTIDGYFKKANFENAVLDGAEMFGVNLEMANLRGCSMKNCDLAQGKLNDAHVAGAVLDGADLMGAKLSVFGLEEAQLVSAENWEYAEGGIVDYYKEKRKEERENA